MVPATPHLPTVITMFTVHRKPVQVYAMNAALISCMPGWLLRVWIPDDWRVPAGLMKYNFVRVVQQCAKEPSVDLQAEGGLFQSGTPVNGQ